MQEFPSGGLNPKLINLKLIMLNMFECKNFECKNFISGQRATLGVESRVAFVGGVREFHLLG